MDSERKTCPGEKTVKGKPNKNQQTNLITAEGWLYLVILAFISSGAVLRNVNLLILISGMMTAPIIINWRLGVLRARTLRAHRSLPYRVHAKAVTGVQWLCLNRSSVSAWGIELIDSIAIDDAPRQTEKPDQEGENDQADVPSFFQRVVQSLKAAASSAPKRYSANNIQMLLPSIGGNQQEVLTSRIYFSKRGIYRFGPARLTTRFPFGLIATTIEMDKSEELYVAPQLGTLTPVWDRRVRSILAGADALLKRRGLAGNDFYALRRWRSGDSRKLIHWRTSAKYGYPIVKQFEEPDNRDFALLLDLYSPDGYSYDGADSERSPQAQVCETCLSFATTVMLNISAAVKGQVALAVCGSETALLQSRSQRELIDLAMREMAVAQPSPNPELVPTLIQLADTVSPRTPLIVVSSRAKIDFQAEETNWDAITRGRLNSVSSSVVWLTVDSAEFKQLFQLGNADEELQTLATKWSEHVSH